MRLVVHGDAGGDRVFVVGQRDHGRHAVLDADPLAGALRSEDQRLAVLEQQARLAAGLAVLDLVPLGVVVHRAVLEDLHERRSGVRVCAVQDRLQVRSVHVDGAGHERGASAQRERQGIDRVVDGALG